MAASRPVRPAERFGWTDILASISDAIVVVDAEGIVSDVNPAAELLTGVSVSQAVGHPTGRAFGARSTNAWIAALVEDTLRESVTHRRAEEELWGAGRTVVVSAACAPVLDTAGTVRGVVNSELDSIRARVAIPESIPLQPRRSNFVKHKRPGVVWQELLGKLVISHGHGARTAAPLLSS